MDFDKCFELLAARPAHAHADCEQAHRHEHRDEEVLADALQSQLTSIHDDNGQEKSGITASEPPPVQPFEELGVVALTQAFFRLQEARVQIYSDFHKGFDVHQQTAFFPEFSAGITARFSAVSTQVNNIEKALISKQQQVLAQYIRKIQLEEKEKLLMTSALLVEKMRLRDVRKHHEDDESNVTSLLETSVETLTSKHAAIIHRINELLDELRAEVMDLSDDEDK